MKGEKNALEWAIFSVSLVLILVTVGYLIADAAGERTQSPDIEVKTGQPVQSAAMWSIPVTVTNRGNETAEQLRVEVSLEKDGHETETAEVTLAFVPRRSSREAWALFRTDPRGSTVTARAVSYERP